MAIKIEINISFPNFSIDKEELIACFKKVKEGKTNSKLIINKESIKYNVIDFVESYDIEEYLIQTMDSVDIDLFSKLNEKYNLDIEIKVSIIYVNGDTYPLIAWPKEFNAFCSKLNINLVIETVVKRLNNPIEVYKTIKI